MGNRYSKSNNSGELEERDIELVMENTSFTRQQIKDWHTSFIVRDLIRFRPFQNSI
jgi:hypothetical protein